MVELKYNQLMEIYKKLPEDLKDAIFSVDSADITRNIGEKNKLTIDKIGELASETGRVMLGITHPNDFISNLADRLETDKEKARAIANDINEQIFKPVRDSLRKIHNIREEGTDVQHSVLHREDILKEIEKDHTKENIVPEIMRGNANPFEEKMKERVLLAPVEEKYYMEEPESALLPEPEKPKSKYQDFDPYREPVE